MTIKDCKLSLVFAKTVKAKNFCVLQQMHSYALNKWMSKFLCDIESNLVMRYSDWAIDRSLKSIFTVLDNRISAFYFDIT